MSDENAPKLRLRPKLAGAPPPTTPAPKNPPNPTIESAQPEPSVPVSEAIPPKNPPAVLRPKLSIKSDDPIDNDTAVAGKGKPPPLRNPTAAVIDDPQLFPPPPPRQALAVRVKPTLKPSDGGSPVASTDAAPPFPFPPGTDKLPAVLNAPPPPMPKAAPAVAETWPAVLDAPPPPGLAPSVTPKGAEDEPAEITAIRKASTFPFPSPSAKFPPLPGLGASADPSSPESSNQESFLKKLLLFGALAIFILAGAGFAYFKFFYKKSSVPSPQPAAVKVETPPGSTAEKIKKAVEKAEQEQFAPLNEAVAANETPAPAKNDSAAIPASPAPDQAVVPATTVAPETGVVAVSPPVPVKPPPPPPSLAFKAWVINLRIRGVRGGEAQRVFIDRTSYAPGDLVNPQLGIIFVGYDEETRMLTFQDKSGATFERRH